MKKTIFILVALMIGIFIVIQFFQPSKNVAPVTSSDFFANIKTPDSIKNKILVSCYDCHSNQTKYPWYNQIAPLSWLISDHITNGKKEMNLSEWGNLSKREQLGVISAIAEVLEEKSMPLPSYLRLHKEAIFSQEETDAVISWVEQTMEIILD